MSSYGLPEELFSDKGKRPDRRLRAHRLRPISLVGQHRTTLGGCPIVSLDLRDLTDSQGRVIAHAYKSCTVPLVATTSSRWCPGRPNQVRQSSLQAVTSTQPASRNGSA